MNHVGLGFVDEDSGMEFVVEYTYNEATTTPFNYSKLSKVLIESEEGKVRLSYARTHSVRVQNKIEHKKCAWEEKKLIAEHISGTVLRLWVRQYVIPFSNTIGQNYKLSNVKARWS